MCDNIDNVTMHKNHGFTLIELLIVIGIIAILAAAVIIIINPGRQFAEARNATRESHAHSLEQAILSYQADNKGALPVEIDVLMQEICNTGDAEEGDSVSCDGMANLSVLVPNYARVIPFDPRRSADSSGTGYYIARDHDGTRIAVIQGLKEISCPEGYIPVPGNPMYGTKDFCVMKWEAKAWDTQENQVKAFGCDDPDCTAHWAGKADQTRYEARSIAEGYPWRSISQSHTTEFNAKQACQAIGANLITNAQWMTIVRNIEAQSANWADGVIGSTVAAGGGLFRGNVNLNDSASCGSNVVLDGETDGVNCLVNGRNKRVHVLSNGEEIWDMAGNVWNWTDNTIMRKDQPVAEGGLEWGWSGYHSEDLARYLSYYKQGNSLQYDNTQSSNPSWGGTQGVGRIYHYSDANDTSTTPRAFLRGGDWGYGVRAGAFSLNLVSTLGRTSTGIGFRCSR